MTSHLSVMQLGNQPVGGKEHDGKREGTENKPLSENRFLGPLGTLDL